MMGMRRAAATLSAIAVSSAVMVLLGREASAAQPTTLDCLTAYEDSLKLRKNHHLRASRAKLEVCSSQSCPADVRAECSGRVPKIDASMPTIVFEARDASGAILVAVKVKMDGELLAEQLQGSALSVDPGEHTFTFEVAGLPSVEKRLPIVEGEKLRRERVDFQVLTTLKPLTSAVTLDESGPVAKPASANARILGVVLGGVGVAATGVGVAYGWIAMSRRDDASAVCANRCPDQDGVRLWNRARSAGNISTGAFIIGAAGIASGVVVWLRARPAAAADHGARVSLGPGGLQLLGRW